jgi:ribonucleoside-diphosphate reductase beta chain
MTSLFPIRLNTYPIVAPDIWSMYKSAVAAFWTVEEVKFDSDYNDFMNLTSDEQHFIKMILAFFAASDSIVNHNLNTRFIQEIDDALEPREAGYEAKVFYHFQTMIEDIHSEMYAIMLDNVERDSVAKDRLINAIHHVPCIREKAQWCKSWIDSDKSFAHRLVAFAIVEGVFFSASFCAIYWIREKNIMNALTKSNELISRDEGMHTDFACLLYNNYIPKHTRLGSAEVEHILKEAVTIESDFISKSIPCSLVGIKTETMLEYIKYVADNLLLKLKYEPIFNAENPFDFMEKISLCKKTNFFDKRVSAYQMACVKNPGKDLQIVDDF